MYLDWIRRFVDAEFTDENWGDKYMMPLGEQPKHIPCMDLLPDPNMEKDLGMIWTAMTAEAEKVDNGEKRNDNQLKLRIRKERYGAALRPRADPDSMFSKPMGAEAEEDFQTFAAAGIGETNLYS